ncbi:hypothetical protein KPL28_08945 [Clostridium algidicarnis]|uniref:hypothetical protein n=1 Tax=Clostridium algidicarnis TaxID=37659 RepID=UPI001C0BD414|nr:hypothetical protein [Clostridium algidicarnis]MBU3209768.1 hypothetical protein [Clostridium algidicarnis]
MFIIRTEEKENIKIFSNGMLIIEAGSYNEIESIISQALKVIYDEYQLQFLDAIRMHIGMRGVA